MTFASEPAVAALAGSMIGGLTTFAVAWMTQRAQARAALRARDRATRFKLYKDFTEEASTLYDDALVNNKVEIPTLIGAYALISRMRIISCSAIVDRADAALRANTRLMSSNFALWISGRTLPSAANAMASARSSRPPL
jgi:hypothetical protein